MIIRSMTATFGKLEHETLTLEPGLNVLHAPNEWGKSTWCAFLVAMFYGLDTRAKSTKSALADKDRYVPWSGTIMSGRMDILWNGRAITIERRTRGRVPLGDFRAYETDSGLVVEELTAANCGNMLLGVERSVFVKAGFIRFQDLPITGDDALRRRLNALVTTGDENGTAETLARKLKEHKNRIRYNRSGLLPLAEAERTELDDKIRELEELCDQTHRAKQRLAELERWHDLLENHRTALAYEASVQDIRQVETARRALESAEEMLRQRQEECTSLPPREQAEYALSRVRQLQERQSLLQMELRTLPEPETLPEVPRPFAHVAREEIRTKAILDGKKFRACRRQGFLLMLLALLFGVCGGVLALWYRIPGLICTGVGLAGILAALVWHLLGRSRAKKLAALYGSADITHWQMLAEEYLDAVAEHIRAASEAGRHRQALLQKLQELNEHIRNVAGSGNLEKCRRDWEHAIALWDSFEDAQRERSRLEKHYQILRSMARPAPPPKVPDELTYSEVDTLQMLSDCLNQRQRLENRLGHYQGRMEVLGTREELESQRNRVVDRIRQLEETYTALTIAQETLAEATAELQRRFAPRITARAQELMGLLTEGRYNRLSLDKDLHVRAGADGEDILRETLWRSDGTVDQLYLALRLAVAEELTPAAPLVLDDALIRFDDKRLKAAMEILKDAASKKQVLLFTCHTREKDMM